MPGIRVVHLPGHTPGSQAVVVETSEGPLVIAGDAVPLYENWEGDEILEHIPSGIYSKLEDYYHSVKRLKSLEARILPGHDDKVFSETRYPASKE